MKNILFLILFVLPVYSNCQTIFTESIGSVGATTSIAAHETANGFDNDAYTMNGSSDIRNTTTSSGYSGASGSANVFFTTTVGKNFQIEGISTIGAASITLSFGALKSTTASNMSEFIFEYSTDGSSYTVVTIPVQPTGAGTAVWRLVSLSLPAAAENQANLRLRWTNSSAAVSFRLDDISLTYVITNTITTSNVLSAPFSVDCLNPASGSVDFTSTGSFNAGNIYTAQLSDAAGSFATPVSIGTLNSTANNGTISVSIPQNTVSGVSYKIRVVSSSPVIIGTESSAFTVNYTNNCSLATTAVSGSPFVINCNSSPLGTVDFSFTGSLIAGNVYTAELSNASGDFSSPVTIGGLNSTATNGSIIISIPSSTAAGTGYRIRVISSSPAAIGTDNGSDLEVSVIACPPPTLPASEGLLINEFSNGSTTEKEYYEFIVAGQCGDIVDIRGFIIDDNNGTFSTVFPSISGIAPGHLKLSNDAQWQAIPVGSLIVVYNADDVNSAIPADDPNDGDNDSLYVIPHNHPTLFDITAELPNNTVPDSTYSPITTYASTSWAALSLRNAGDAVQVRTPGGDYFHGVSYGDSEMTGGPDNLKITTSPMGGMCGWFTDGDIFNASNWSTGTVATNQTPGLPNNAANLVWLRAMRDPTGIDCPIVVLPSTAVNLTAKYVNGKGQIDWQTASEQNNDYFTLSHSRDGKQFELIGTIEGAGNSNDVINYRFIHQFPHPGWNYYKLQSTDYDGTSYNKGIVSLKAEFNFSYYNSSTESIELFYVADIEIYSVDGKLVESANDVSTLSFNRSGLFILLDKRTGITERLFIP